MKNCEEFNKTRKKLNNLMKHVGIKNRRELASCLIVLEPFCQDDEDDAFDRLYQRIRKHMSDPKTNPEILEQYIAILKQAPEFREKFFHHSSHTYIKPPDDIWDNESDADDMSKIFKEVKSLLTQA